MSVKAGTLHWTGRVVVGQGQIAPTTGPIDAHSLLERTTPAAGTETIAALLKNKSYRSSTSAHTAGTALIDWYYRPKRSRVLVATGTVHLAAPGERSVVIKLTPAGEQLLAHAQHLTLTADDSFTPANSRTATATGAFRLAS